MVKYRIVRKPRGSSKPVSIWVDKPTDEDVVVTATALLGRGESADVWSENALVKRIQRTEVRRTGPRVGDLLAGLAMTISLGLLLTVGHGIAPNAVLDPPDKLSHSAATGDAPDTKQIVSSESLPAPAVEAEAPIEAAPGARDEPPAPGANKVRRMHRDKPRLASAPGTPRTALFPAAPHPQTNVYGLMSSGFAQGGN